MMSDGGRVDGGSTQVHADLGALTELSARLAAVDDSVTGLVAEATSLLGALDPVIGVDDAAQAFRAGFGSLSGDVVAAADRATGALTDHRHRIERGIRDIGAADTDAGLRLGPA